MTEKQLHSAIVKLVKAFGLWPIHVPNEGQRDAREAAILRTMGVEAGTPDILVIGSEGRTMWLEVKGPLGKLSPRQHAWHARARELGHTVVVVQSLDAAAFELSSRFGWPQGMTR